MEATSHSHALWEKANIWPLPRKTPIVVVLSGIDSSEIIEAALTDTTLTDAAMMRFEPDCTAPCDANLWRLETATGEAVNSDGLLDRLWFRPPYALTLRLAHYGPGSTEPDVLDEGTIGTRAPRDVFQATVDRLAMRFVRDAILGRSRGRSGLPPAPPPHGPPGWINHLGARWHNRVMTEWWSLGVSDTSVDGVLAGDGLASIHWFNKGVGRAYLADPFPWPGTDRILAEEMPMNGGVGQIVALSHDGQRVTESEIILDDGDHHSYPSTYQDGGLVYCVPESTERGSTRIHALERNGTLTPVCSVAPHSRLADPTLFRCGGLLWIACTDLDLGDHDNLCLLHAPEISGPWEPHARWPVRIDVRGARPAGAVFERQGRLFRPGQDCASTYGAAVVLHEIEILNETEFSETRLTILHPNRSGPFPHGLHTLVHDGKRWWVDGKRFVFDGGSLRRKALGRLWRISSRSRGS